MENYSQFWKPPSADESRLEDLREVESILQYSFHNPGLLQCALTHSSSTADDQRHNERMEFFGDAILDFVICEHLVYAWPGRREGELTELKSDVVRRGALAEVMSGLGIRNYIILGRGIAQSEELPDSVYANIFEAIVAAIYLDGGLAAAREFVLRFLDESLRTAGEGPERRNFKSLLQQRLQRDSHSVPSYVVISESGPDHLKDFEVAVLIHGKERGRGKGANKKAAEQAAARKALEVMEETG